MGLIKAFTDSFRGVLADQWKDIITAGTFDEHTVVAPGVLKSTNNGRGTNTSGSAGVITNGSKIFVPENTAAFIFSQAGIERIITTSGGFEYRNGEASIFDGASVETAIIDQAEDRFGYGGISDSQKEIAFVNLREIRNIKFGTKAPLIYNDHFYGCDLEICAYGAFSLKVTDPELFIRNFVPANTTYYSFDDERASSQLMSEFLQSFTVALNVLSNEYRISQLPAQTNDISLQILQDPINAGTWKERFGLEIVHVSIENISFSPESKKIINKFNADSVGFKAVNLIKSTADTIFRHIPTSGNAVGKKNKTVSMSLDEQIETVKKLKELVEIGALSQDEFEIKKRDIMNLK